MKQKYIETFVGTYRVSENSPSRYVHTSTGIEIAIVKRSNRAPNQTPHYLVTKEPNEKKFSYFTGLWKVGEGKNVYRISDYIKTGKPKLGYAVLDMFSLTITTTEL